MRDDCPRSHVVHVTGKACRGGLSSVSIVSSIDILDGLEPVGFVGWLPHGPEAPRGGTGVPSWTLMSVRVRELQLEQAEAAR